MKLNPRAYFLPYQIRWLANRSRFKIWEKSRRVGATYVQSYEDVRDAAIARGGVDVWFSSADESAAREYIHYAKQWARLLDIGARDLGERALDGEDDVKVFEIEFTNGKRINALRSSPRALRSKGGKVVLDEYAHHTHPEEMWAAAQPASTWGFPMRILSTYNGQGNRYYRLVNDAHRGLGVWSLESTPIQLAVDEGLADKIVGRPLSLEERAQWLAELEATVNDPDAWQQEYCCIPIDSATAYLTWEQIIACESDQAGNPADYAHGSAFVGYDVARRRDLAVIWVLEQVGDVLVTREVVSLRNASFAAQEAELDRVLRDYRVLRVAIDQTGMGEPLVEQAKRRYGSTRVEGVLFTGPAKQELAQGLKQRFEDRRVRIPQDKAIREAHHAVRRILTSAGNPRFDADRLASGHADEFWAHALAVHAATNPAPPIEFGVRGLVGEAAPTGLDWGWVDRDVVLF
jgi:phage FluMu gp28-like protein